MSDAIQEFDPPLNPLSEDAQVEASAAQKARAEFDRTHSVFSRTMKRVMVEYLQARAEGFDRFSAVKGIEAALREVWPASPTHFPPLCERCDDTGYEEWICRLVHRCERPKCRTKGDDWEHPYVVPCVCFKGDRFRAKAPSQSDAIEEAAKVSKPKRGWSRAGA